MGKLNLFTKKINIRFDIPGIDIVQYPEYDLEYDKA